MHHIIKNSKQLRPMLLSYRQSAQKSQTDMATMLGISQQSYAKLEAKPETASFKRLMQVFDLLGVQLIATQALDGDY